MESLDGFTPPGLPQRKESPMKTKKSKGSKRAAELLTDPEAPKKPKQARLPQMDDPQIEELESLAESYAEVRDQRLALTPQEKKLKDDLLAAMKRNKKETYKRDGIEVRVVHEEETVKVKITKDKDE